MSDFFPLRHNRLSRDISLIRKLEAKQRQLEEKALNSKKAGQFRRFKAHPNLIQTGSDTSVQCTPRIKTGFSSSTSDLVYDVSRASSSLMDTKQRAQNFHRLLHEKLSIIDSNPSERIDLDEVGDNYMVSQKDIGDRYQNLRPKSYRSDSSIGSMTIDSNEDVSHKITKFKRNNKLDNNRLDNNYSAASKTTSGAERRSADSRLSSQQSFCPRGIPVSVFERKFKAVVAKSLENIAGIRNTLAKGIVPPDGEEDESRRIVRVKEFSNRFSRNYLYPQARQLKELSIMSNPDPLVANQKLLSTYQVLHNALQAYQTHLPLSLGDCDFTQLKILMGNIVKVCEFHRKQLKDHEENYIVEFIDTFKINAELIIQKLDECSLCTQFPTQNVLKSDQTKISLSRYGDKSNRKQKKAGKDVVSKTKFDKRLSMYTMTASFRRDAPWKRAVEGLAKKKFNVKSRYRTATFRHRPPVQKASEINSLPKFKGLLPAKQPGDLRTTRLNSPINEDSIQTMVEAEGNGETHIEKEIWENMEKKGDESKKDVCSNKEEILIKLLQYTLKNHNQGPSEDSNSQISEILNLIKSEPSEEFLKKIVASLMNKGENVKNSESRQQLTLEIAKSQCSLSEDAASSRDKNKRKELKITMSGDKNARLICITDDNSVIEPPEDEESEDNKIRQTENTDPPKIMLKTPSRARTKTQAPSHKVSKRMQKGNQPANIKISRLKKSGRNLKPLDKKLALNAIQYKLDFYRYCKNNPMYKRTTTCQPWIIMSKISEELLNHCLLTVAREIEINDIVEKVYQSELQL